MKTKKIALLLFAMASFTIGFGQKSGKSKSSTTKNKTDMNLKTEIDSVSYGFGVSIAENLSNQGVETLNIEALAKGMADYLSKTDLLIDKEQIGTLVQGYMQQLQEEKSKKQSEEGTKFLAENAKKKGVITLPSGLQYEIIKKGDGPIPVASDKVSTHYHGTLIDGTVFDSSVQRGTPADFGVTQVIKGWQEALQLMPVGSKWRLYLPYNLAYGERGAGGAIGPYATLIFDIELLSIIK